MKTKRIKTKRIDKMGNFFEKQAQKHCFQWGKSMLLENKNTAFSMQFDSYCHATKKHFFAKAILLLTNEPTLVRENLLCYFAKNIPFTSFLIILYSKSIFIMPPKTSKSVQISSRIQPMRNVLKMQEMLSSLLIGTQLANEIGETKTE